MTNIYLPGRIGRRGVLAGATVSLAAPALLRRAAADEPVQLLSHRYPALEFYGDKVKSALPGVPVNARLMPSGEATSLERIGFSSGDTSLDLVWANGAMIPGYAKAGWLEPLDDLWAKHRDEFKLDDISPAALRGCSFDGHIYAMPITINTLLYAYRDDLFEQNKLTPPKTWDDAVAIAKALNSPRRNGISLSLKWDQPPYELQSVLNTVGDGWFDKEFHPIFNDDRGVAAIDTFRRLAAYAVPGYTAQGNDESTVNFAQDVAATGQQWATRCSTMDNPAKSRVVGKIKWATPPGGHQGLSVDAYAISRASRRDKDTLFRILATALNDANQREGAALAVPTRRGVLNDPAIQAKYRWYPAVSAALDTAQPFPSLPEFIETAELSTKRMVQAIIGQLPTKEALDDGAGEVADLLKRRGYKI